MRTIGESAVPLFSHSVLHEKVPLLSFLRHTRPAAFPSAFRRGPLSRDRTKAASLRRVPPGVDLFWRWDPSPFSRGGVGSAPRSDRPYFPFRRSGDHTRGQSREQLKGTLH